MANEKKRPPGADKNPWAVERRDWKEVSKRVGLAAIPWVGGSITELLSAWRENIANERARVWAESVEERICRLEELSDQHCALLMKGAVIASLTTEQEKLEYLRNAVSNLILEDSEELDATIFMDLISRLTATHIKVLFAFERTSGPSSEIDPDLLRAFGISDDHIQHIVISLGREGLLNQSVSMKGTQPDKVERVTGSLKPLGERFLRFLRDPAGY